MDVTNGGLSFRSDDEQAVLGMAMSRSQSEKSETQKSKFQGVRAQGAGHSCMGAVAKAGLFMAILALCLAGYVSYRLTMRDAHPELLYAAGHRDNVLWQTLDGIAKGLRPSQEMDKAVQVLALNGRSVQIEEATSGTRISGRESSLYGKLCVVTGGNRGLGRAIAARLISLGANVIVTSRSESQSLADELKKEASMLYTRTVSPVENQIVKVIALDLSDFASIDRTVERLREFGPIDRLILNAGLAPQEYSETKQGFEIAVGVNCIGHLRFARQLLAAGQVVQGARIVVVTSETHRAAPSLDFDNLFSKTPYGMLESMDYYARSKLAMNTAFTELTRRVESQGIKVHLICPGPVATDIASNSPWWVRPFVDAMMATTFQTPDRASLPVLVLAGSERFGKETGAYFHMYKESKVRADAADPEKGRALWERIDAEIAQRWGK